MPCGSFWLIGAPLARTDFLGRNYQPLRTYFMAAQNLKKVPALTGSVHTGSALLCGPNSTIQLLQEEDDQMDDEFDFARYLSICLDLILQAWSHLIPPPSLLPPPSFLLPPFSCLFC